MHAQSFWTAGAVVGNSASNVGVKIATPATDLEVRDSLRVASTGGGNFITITSPGAFHDISSTNNVSFSFGGSLNMRVGGSATSRLFIASAGNVGVATTSPTSTLDNHGSFAVPVTTQTTNYTATATDYTILCNAGSLTVTLPSASSVDGRIYTIKKVSGTGGNITIDPNGSETIDGALTNTAISAQYQSLIIQSDGANWFILARY